MATNVETTRQTNDAGLYVIKPLPPGEYKLVVSRSGFLTLIQEKIIVDSLSTATVDLSLKVGNVNETVTKGSPLPMRSTSIGESREIEITLEFEVPWRSPRAVWIGG